MMRLLMTQGDDRRPVGDKVHSRDTAKGDTEADAIMSSRKDAGEDGCQQRTQA